MPSVLNKICSLFILLCCLTLLIADDKTIIQNIAKKYVNTPAFSAVIKQKNIYKIQNKTLISEGNFYKESKIYLIEFDKPYYQFVLFNNPEIILYDSSLKTAHIIKNNNYSSFNPDQLFNELDKGNFSISKNKDIYILEIPFFKDSIDAFKLKIDSKDLLILQISYQDSMENQIVLNFSKQLFNQKSKKNLKNYQIPKHTKIINL